ncbi:MAG: TolC family outer membrane protein [Burkholderiaceae bacterium]
MSGVTSKTHMPHRSSLFVAASVAALICTSVNATDLLEAYRLAQGSDPTFESARYALEAAQQKIPQARSAFLPVLNTTGSKGTTHANTEFTGVPPVDRNMHSWAWNLQLTQPLLRAGSAFAYLQSESIVEQATAQYQQAQQDLLLRVAQAYFGVIVAQDVIAASDAEVQALEEQLAQVKRGFTAGTHSLTDIDDTQSRLGLARSQRVAAKNDLESKRADLEKVTGQSLTQLAVLQATAAPTQPQPLDARAWMDQARSNHPAVRAQRAALAAAQSEIKKNAADYAPTLDLVSSYGSNYASNSLTTPTDYSTRASSRQIGLQLNIPIYSGGMTNSKVIEAIANRNKAQADLEAARRQAATDAQQAYAGVVNGLAQIEALNVALASGQSAVKGNRVGYRLGIRINIDVLNAEQQLYTSQRDWTKARYDTLLQGLKLKAATGSLTEEDVTGVNAMLVQNQVEQPVSNVKVQEPTPVVLLPVSTVTVTPPAAPSTSLSSKDNPGTTNEQVVVIDTVNAWVRSWCAKDIDTYLAFYSSDFTPQDNLSHQMWAEQRHQRIMRAGSIDIKLDAPHVTVDGNMATVTFRQNYRSDHVKDVSSKTLELVKQDGNWKIRQEHVDGRIVSKTR